MAETILLVSNLYPPRIVGGAELIAHYQARELQKLGCNVHVFAGEGQLPGSHYAVSRDVCDGIPVERIFLNSQDFSSAFVNFFHPEIEARFLQTLDRVRPDIVHVHNIIGLSAGIISLAAQRGIPVVVTLHDHWGFCHRNTLVTIGNKICRDFTRCAECQSSIDGPGDLNIPVRLRNDYLWLQMQHVSRFLSPSRYLAAACARAGFPEDRLQVLWNGADVNRLASVRKRSHDGPMRFSYIGYMGEHKGLWVLFDALKRIRSQGESCRINLVGDGHLRAELEQHVTASGLSRSVRFWGKVPNESITDVFKETDVQLLPSVWPENQPVSITEAMATRTAVIASNTGGIPELVEHGRTGLLFEPGNSEQLADCMLNLIRSPELARQLGEEGFLRIQDASLARQASRLLDLYRRTFPVRDAVLSRFLIACCGPRFDSRAFQAVEEISSRFGMYNHAFVMQSWLTPEQTAAAKALLVLPETSYGDVLNLTKYGVPLVVPADIPGVVDLCIQTECGLYYETSAEAAECLVWILEHPGQLPASAAIMTALHASSAADRRLQ